MNDRALRAAKQKSPLKEQAFLFGGAEGTANREKQYIVDF